MNDFLQELNYSYNAQRWLTKINNPLQTGGGGTGTGSGTREDSEAAANDLFYFRINYNIADGDLNARSQKSGNISKLTWQVAGSGKLNLYGFDYDFLDRVKRSTYATEDGDGKVVSNDFGTTYAYDGRGNITQLTRKGRNDGIIQTIDSLNYTYFSGSNQIQQIGDDAPCPEKIVQDEDIEQSVDYRASQCITFKEGFSFKAAEDGTMTAKIECASGIKYTRGFQDRSNSQDYQYDSSGNLTFDA
ncbi:MAG: hypothetical protein AAGG68_29775, partial [Bacteroidota bacterium]